MRFNPEQPFNDLPLLPPELQLESRAVLKQAIKARSALAELKGLGETIPDQGVLLNSITLQEAQASSEIENIVTTTDELFQAFTSESGTVDSATKEVLRYREALWKAYDKLKSRPLLTTNLFVEIVQAIRKNEEGIRKISGIKIANKSNGQVIYTPPEGETVIRDKLRNLEDFIHADDEIDPLVKLAVLHYQFESIHPFSDGNGRTGRIINILYLVQQGLIDQPVLYLSKAIIKTKPDYYRLLRDVTEKQAWEPWILYMLGAVEETAILTRERVLAIRELMEKTLEHARKELPGRVYSKELIEIIFRQPYTKVQFLVDAGIAKRQTAADYLKELEKVGILEAHKRGRETLYLNKEFYELLSR